MLRAIMSRPPAPFRPLHVPFAASLLAAALVAGPGALSAAATDIVLGHQPVEIEVDAADITVALDRVPARLSSRPGRTEVGADGDADEPDLDITFGSDGVHIRRRPPVANRETARPRLHLEVVIAPLQHLRLVGNDLALSIAGDLGRSDDAAGEPDAEAARPVPRQMTPTKPPDPDPPCPLELALDSSEVELRGVGDLGVTLTASRLRSETSRGALRVVAEAGSEVELLDHQGLLRVEASDSDVVVVRSAADLDLRLEAANALLREGRGHLQVHARGGLLAVEEWSGLTQIEADGGAVELRALGPQVTIAGRTLNVTAEKGRGVLDIRNLAGGEIRLLDWVGRTSIEQEGGAFDASGTHGPMRLALRANAQATVSDSEGLVQAILEHAELTLTRASQIEIDARHARVSATGVRRLNRVAAIDSHLDFDLTQARNSGPLVADADSRLVLALREPCRVIVGGTAGAAGGRGVRAERCFLHLAGGAGATFAPKRAGRTSVVRVELALGAELEVEGHSAPEPSRP